MDDFDVVVVGYSRYLLSRMSDVLQGVRVAVIEEPDVCASRGLADAVAELSADMELVPWEYQAGWCGEGLLQRHGRLAGVHAVFPGVEYAVPFAAELADLVGASGAGTGAAEQLRDKFLLRNAAERAGLANPRYSLVSTAEEVESFLESVDGACVLKPTSRQASVGVQFVEPGDDIALAWKRTVGADEGRLVPQRGVTTRFLAEERIVGPEFSVELLVREGNVLHANVTEKRVRPGRFPVETAHIVPATVDARRQRSLVDSTRRLANAIGFGSGVLHCEWIVEGAEDVLVECAGRIPGDNIPELISLSYGFSFIEGYVDLLHGKEVFAPAAPVQASAIRFFMSPREAGTKSRAEVLETHGVVDFQYKEPIPTAGEGLLSSWDRCGYVMARANTGAEAERLTARFADGEA